MPISSVGWECSRAAWIVLTSSMDSAHEQHGSVQVPVANRLANEGDGFKIAMTGLDGGRVNIGAISIGAAQQCLDVAVDYTKERKQFNKRIADFQVTQFKLADMATSLASARLMVYNAASMLDADSASKTVAAAMAKQVATENSFEVCDQALQLHGGYGYLKVRLARASVSHT